MIATTRPSRNVRNIAPHTRSKILAPSGKCGFDSSRLFHIDLAPTSRRDGALDHLAAGGRFELQAGRATLPLVRCLLVGDHRFRCLGLGDSSPILAEDATGDGGGSGGEHDLPQDRAPRRRRRPGFEYFVHCLLRRWGQNHGSSGARSVGSPWQAESGGRRADKGLRLTARLRTGASLKATDLPRPIATTGPAKSRLIPA